MARRTKRLSPTNARKPRGPNRVRKREVVRVVGAAKSAGASRVEIDPQTGRYVVILASGEAVADNEVENWLSKQRRAT